MPEDKSYSARRVCRKLKVGDKVTVRSDIYLGQWVESGKQGVIVRIGNSEGRTIYHINVEGKQYSFVRSELE